ncbi:hypothetical protein [Limnohabitans sp.]|jgi:hypothetical protein|uniref:hypothetical protein n=1 Tax=Limnohabitans sp. TaxID=1907725 RepID=UPI0025C5BDF9|nr:hypothetical protein [Limnohabitans sp.]
MTGIISVDWECVTDGKTAQGAIFKSNILDLLNAGYNLQVELADGSKGPLFTESEKFALWFDSI